MIPGEILMHKRLFFSELTSTKEYFSVVNLMLAQFQESV